MNREKAIFLIAGVAFGLTAAFLTGQVQHISEGQASQKLISTLESIVRPTTGSCQHQKRKWTL